MVATWLTELSLDRLNRALLEQGEDGEADNRVEQLTEELRAFLKQQVELLDPRTTITLLASYGRLDDLMHYAFYRQVMLRMSNFVCSYAAETCLAAAAEPLPSKSSDVLSY